MSDEAQALRPDAEWPRRLVLSLYRPALLLTGAADLAAQALAASAAAVLANRADPVGAALQSLAGWQSPRGVRWSWLYDQAQLDRARFDPVIAGRLLELISGCAPRERLMLGLVYLRGQSVVEAAALLGDAQAAERLRSVRVVIARDLTGLDTSLAPQELQQLDAYLDEALDPAEATVLRRQMLGDEELRRARDALARCHELLARALPLLFSAVPPPELVVQLGPQPDSAAPTQRPAAWRYRLALAGGVALLLALLLTLPRRQPTSAAMPTLGNAPVSDPQALVEAAIHRLDRPPLSAGVLHEAYRIDEGKRPLLLERWYEYAPPHRFKLTLGYEGEEQALLVVASDGERQLLYGFREAAESGLQRLTITSSAAEIAQALPLLRQMPMFNFLPGWTLPGQGNPSYYYLGRARESKLTLLGATSWLSREATLVSYLLADPQAGNQAAPRERVVLTIERETYALLDIAIFPLSDGPVSSRHPWQAQIVEVVAELPPGILRLPPGNEQQRDLQRLPNPRLPQYLIDGELIDLDQVLRTARQPLLLPQVLPFDGMRGMIVDTNRRRTRRSPLFLYEHEFGTLIVVGPGNLGSFRSRSELRSAGDYRYTLPKLDGDEERSGISRVATLALVFGPAGEDPVAGLFLVDEFAGPASRERRLAQAIASLALLTQQSKSQFEEYFR